MLQMKTGNNGEQQAPGIEHHRKATSGAPTVDANRGVLAMCLHTRVNVCVRAIVCGSEVCGLIRWLETGRTGPPQPRPTSQGAPFLFRSLPPGQGELAVSQAFSHWSFSSVKPSLAPSTGKHNTRGPGAVRKLQVPAVRARIIHLARQHLGNDK